MSFYGNKGQPSGVPGQVGGGQRAGQSEVNLTPQLFNFTQSQLQFQGGHNLTFPDPNNPSIQMQNIQLAPGGAPQLLLQQQPSSFPNLNVNFLTEHVGQILQPSSANQSQSINLITPMSVALSGMTFAQTGIQTQPPTTSQQQSQQAKQRVFTGTVTKIHDSFGFIDEDVFFHMSVVKGPILPKPGDRVLVEADFNPSMPFHWNATRVQIVNMGTTRLSHLNLNPGGKPPSPSPQALTHNSQANQSVLQAAQHTSSASAANLLNMNQFNQNHQNNTKSNQHQNQQQNPMSQSGVQQQQQQQSQQANRYPPSNSNAVSMVSNPPYGGGRNNNNMSRAEENSRVIAHSRAPMTRPPPPCITTPASSMVSLPMAVDVHNMQHLQLPLQLPMSAVPLQLRDVGGGVKDRERDGRERERERDARERERERDARERERERDREKERREKRSIEDKKDRERERQPPVRSRERSSSKRRKDEGIKRDMDKEKSEISSSRSIRNRSPIQPRDSRKRSRSKDKEKPRESVDTKSSRSPSPKRLAVLSRPSPRYGWELPKISLDETEVNISELKRRYKNLYIPSDFFLAKCSWQESLPLHTPLDLSHSCPVHIFRRYPEKVELQEFFCGAGNSNNNLGGEGSSTIASLNPSDESDSLKVKVILLSLPNKSNLYRKACGLAEEASLDVSLQHLNRLINFVVGTKVSKNETMIVGGAWSPSLDGPNAESPQVLINTAIRTCKALTGLDLRRCTKWYRFMDLYYRRSSGSLETVVVLLPNLWAALPSRKEWEEIQKVYKEALHVDKEKTATTTAEGAKSTIPRVVEDHRGSKASSSEESTPSHDMCGTTPPQQANSGADKGTVDNPNTNSLVKMEAIDAEIEDGELKEEMDTDKNPDEFDIYGDLPLTPSAYVKREVDEEKEESEIVPQPMDQQSSREEEDKDVVDGQNKLAVAEGDVPQVVENSNSETEGTGGSVVGSENLERDVPMEEGEEENAVKEENKGTHFSLLDPKHMTVPKLKEELSRRGLNTKGLKSQLMTRLLKTLKAEESAEKAKEVVEEKSSNEDEVPLSGENTERDNDSVAVNESAQGDECTSDAVVPTASPLTPPTDAECTNYTVSGKDDVTKTLDQLEQNDQDKVIEEASKLLKDNDEPAVQKSTLDSSMQNVVENRQAKNESTRKDDGSLKVGDTNTIVVKTLPAPPTLANRNKKSGLSVQVPVFSTPDTGGDKLCDNEKTRKIWERRYALPKSAHLLLHPSPKAKSGVFDCNQHSLNTLRDYRVADNKEQSFEVSLCAEFFHEMLQRDFAFRIFRELVYQAKKVGGGTTTSSSATLNKTEDIKNDDDAKDDKVVNGLGSKEEGGTVKKRKLSSSSSVTGTVKPAMKTVDPNLLLAFVFFDHTRCGYITDVDLEDLCLSLNLGLTRAQIRKLVQKVVLKGVLHYRKWTDSPVDENLSNVDTLPVRDDGSEESLKRLAQGNKNFLPTFGRSKSSLSESMEFQEVNLHPESGDNLRQEMESLLAALDGDSMIDPKKLRDQIEKIEKDRVALNANIQLYKSSLTEAKVQISQLKLSQDMVKEELIRVKEVLKKYETAETSNQAELEIFRHAAQRFVDRVKDLVKPNAPIKDLKSSKDKEIVKKEKSDETSIIE